MKDKTRLYDYYLSRNPLAYDKYAVLDFGKIYLQFDSYFNRFLPKDRQAKILDLGCGSGAFVSWLHAKGYENVEGVDISQEQIDTGTKRDVKNLKCVNALEFLRDHKDEYALISAHDLIEHFEKEEILCLLNLIFEALGKGGSVLVSTVNAESLFSARHRYYDFTHEVGFTPHSLSQVLYFTGFTDVKVFPKEPYVHGLKSAVRWLLWKGIKQLICFYLLVETGSRGFGVYTEVMYGVGRKMTKDETSK